MSKEYNADVNKKGAEIYNLYEQKLEKDQNSRNICSFQP